MECSVSHSNGSDKDPGYGDSPLPIGQLTILAIMAFAEQTALNSISSYLPEMISTFPGVSPQDRGLYVGTVVSSFALAQFGTSFFWGWLSDRIGRKPVVMLGTTLTAICFVAFGFCKNLRQAILVQVLMGLVNGNQGVISTCLGEITDRSNQSRAFLYLPVIYGIGAISGPALGGCLIKEMSENIYPFLLPNLASAAILIIDLILTGFFLKESLVISKYVPPLEKQMGSIFTALWQYLGSARRFFWLHIFLLCGSKKQNNYCEEIQNETDNDEHCYEPLLSVREFPISNPNKTNSKQIRSQICNRNTLILLATYLIFQLSNVSYNSLYPIFASELEPIGRNLTAEEIGLSLSFAGLITIVFQIGIFGQLKEKLGNIVTYRAGLFLFFVSMIITPWVGYRHSPPLLGWGTGTIWLWIELGFVLSVKTVAAVGGLTSASLLITNTAPTHAVLGTLNGLAQTLSAAGRALGPFLAGGLFSIASRKFHREGGIIAWAVFGGVAFLGFLASFGLTGSDLESRSESRSSSDSDSG